MIDITILHWRISPYFICFLLSFVLAYLYVTWYLKKAGVRGSHIFYSELLNTVLALYFGAFYTFIVQLTEQGKVETFGFSSLGGMAGILLGVWIFTKISKEHKIELWTAYVLALGLMYAVSKLGCFFAGCCYGRETDAWYGITFTHSDFAPNGVKLIPTQLISSAGDFLICGILLWYAAKKPKPGRVASLYLLLYGMGRFLIEFLRDDYRGSLGIFSTSQIISFGVVALGIVLYNVIPKVAKEA